MPRATLLLSAALLLALSGCMMPDRGKQAAANAATLAKEGITLLKAGDAAPLFSAPGADGQPVDPFAGAPHYTVLFFFPAVDTPNSAAELIALTRNLDKLREQNIQLYAIGPAATQELAAFAAKYKIAVPLLSDPQLAVAQQYRCAKPGATYAQRALIGVKQDGTVAFADYTHYWAANALKSILDGFGIEAAKSPGGAQPAATPGGAQPPATPPAAAPPATTPPATAPPATPPASSGGK